MMVVDDHQHVARGSGDGRQAGRGIGSGATFGDAGGPGDFLSGESGD